MWEGLELLLLYSSLFFFICFHWNFVIIMFSWFIIVFIWVHSVCDGPWGLVGDGGTVFLGYSQKPEVCDLFVCFVTFLTGQECAWLPCESITKPPLFQRSRLTGGDSPNLVGLVERKAL